MRAAALALILVLALAASLTQASERVGPGAWSNQADLDLDLDEEDAWALGSTLTISGISPPNLNWILSVPCNETETWSFDGLEPCFNCTKCASGVPEQSPCNVTHNTVCEDAAPCAERANFSSTGFEPCFACTSCSKFSSQCTPTQNARCSSSGFKDPPDLGTSAAYVAVGIALVLLIATYLTVSHFYFAHMRIMRQQGRLQGSDGSTTATHDSNFKQQRLSVWRPRMTPSTALCIFFGLGVVLVVMGGVFLGIDSKVKEFTFRYDKICGAQLNCPVHIRIPEDMESPVFVYYGLSEFYQNHRVYVKSRDSEQLLGRTPDPKSCDPLSRYGDYTGDKTDPSYNDSLSNLILYPCGLVAQSFFTDRFEGACLVDSPGDPCSPGPWGAWQRSGIAWPSDLDKFKSGGAREGLDTSMNPRGFEMPDVVDEDFVVWMRTATLPYWWKPYAKINTDLEAGKYLHLNITNDFPASTWDSTKELKFSTTSGLGSSSPFMGGLFLAVGIICLLFGVFVYLKVHHDGHYEPIPEGYMVVR